MANGHVDIHDPFNGHNGISGSPDSPKLSVPHSEDMIEFRILMAYATRRQRESNGNNVSGTPSAQTEITEPRKRKKMKIWKRLPKVMACLKPKTQKENDDCQEDTGNVGYKVAGPQQEDNCEDVAARLVEISDEIPFDPPEIETDAPDDDVEKVIGLLLRDAGDRLYERELKGTDITGLLGNYSFFEQVILSLLTRMGLGSNTETLGPKVATKTQIAVTCEATSRLSVLDTLPMNRVLGHGARFLRTRFSPWAQQHGGYENAFESEDEGDVH